MSIAIMTEVWKIEGLSPSQKLVFLSLADNANDQGECYPSMRQIAARTCLSERAVRDAVRGLERLGYVSSASRAGTSSTYFLTTSPENLNQSPRQMPPPTPAGNAAPANAAPRQEMPPTPAPVAAPPRQMPPPTPAAAAPKPSFNRHLNRQLTVERPPGSDRGSRLPDDWTLPEDWSNEALGLRSDLSPDAVRKLADGFRDYWIAQPGAKGRKANWLATWRNWVRKDAEYSRRGRSNGPAATDQYGVPL